MSDGLSRDVTVALRGQSVRVEAGSVTPVVRVYYSTFHLAAARRFTNLAAESEAAPKEKPRFDIDQRSFVTGAILAAVGFLEAAVNELCQDIADGHESYITPIDNEARVKLKVYWDLTEGQRKSVPLLDKYQAVLGYCMKAPFAKGELLYQDAKVAVDLRNELTHYKPASYGGVNQSQFLEKLRGKFASNPLMSGLGNPYFPDHCLGSPCAAWMVRAITSFVDEFFHRLGVTPNYQRASF